MQRFDFEALIPNVSAERISQSFLTDFCAVVHLQSLEVLEGQLKEVREKHALEREEWDAERDKIRVDAARKVAQAGGLKSPRSTSFNAEMEVCNLSRGPLRMPLWSTDVRLCLSVAYRSLRAW